MAGKSNAAQWQSAMGSANLELPEGKVGGHGTPMGRQGRMVWEAGENPQGPAECRWNRTAVNKRHTTLVGLCPLCWDGGGPAGQAKQSINAIWPSFREKH